MHALVRLNSCFKHAAALGLEVDLQVTAKARTLLGKQRHKTINVPAMDWQDVPTFYQTLCQTTTLPQLALRLLILTDVQTILFVIFLKIRLKGIYGLLIL